MFQNIKVDIIYYKTNTDFELEFNLCGCCRMRLLTDKASDKKTLVHELARGVSRSRVILIAGNLFGEDGIIEIVSQAIGKSVAEVDAKNYGIASTDKITILNGSTPLVTPEGYFGGCIIESGPQSMILLSENKIVRKSIMNTLIHPYIEELCIIELKEKDVSALPQEEDIAVTHVSPVTPVSPVTSVTAEVPVSDEMPEQPSETESSETEIADAPEESAQSDNNGETPTEEKEEDNIAGQAEQRPLNEFATEPEKDGVTLSGGMIFESEGKRSSASDYGNPQDNIDLYIEPMKIKRGDDSYLNERYALSYEQDQSFYTDDVGPQKKSHPASSNLPILIISIILLIVLAILCYCIFYVPAKEGISATAYLQETFGILFG